MVVFVKVHCMSTSLRFLYFKYERSGEKNIMTTVKILNFCVSYIYFGKFIYINEI